MGLRRMYDTVTVTGAENVGALWLPMLGNNRGEIFRDCDEKAGKKEGLLVKVHDVKKGEIR